MDESKPPSGPVNVSMAAAAPTITGGPSGKPLQEWVRLVQRMAEGEQDAVRLLYDDTSGFVFGLALRMLRTREDAEELVLDVYAKAWRLAGKFDPSRSGVLPWLLMMTRSMAIDRIRSGAKRTERTQQMETVPERTSGAASPEDLSLWRQRQRFIQGALQKLPWEQREAIELAFFSGLTHQEIAGRLNAPLGTVKSRLRLGMLRLRELLGGLTE